MLSGLLIANTTLLVVIALRLLPSLASVRARYAAGLILSSAAYFLSWLFHAQPIPTPLRWLLFLAVLAQPVFFWLTTLALFDDRFRVRWWHLVIIAGRFSLALALFWNRPVSNVFISIASEDLPRLIPNFFYSLALVLHALVIVVQTSKSDLVERRRRLRLVALFVAGLLTAHAILSAAVLRPLGYGSVSDLTGLWLVAVAAAALAAWGDLLWRDLFTPSQKGPAQGEAEQSIMAQALEAMEKHEAFRTEGLTVSALADQLGVPEYKLRRAINAGLGYRNFNEYLNFYRMRAAKKFLADAQNRDYPLIHLALDLGYPSPAPFNRAFREATGMTPGEFRKKSQTPV